MIRQLGLLVAAVALTWALAAGGVSWSVYVAALTAGHALAQYDGAVRRD